MYQVKNIDRSDWKNHPYMIIRDCRDEQAPNDGWWYWASYDCLETASRWIKELYNGIIVESKDVEPYEQSKQKEQDLECLCMERNIETQRASSKRFPFLTWLNAKKTKRLKSKKNNGQIHHTRTI